MGLFGTEAGEGDRPATPPDAASLVTMELSVTKTGRRVLQEGGPASPCRRVSRSSVVYRRAVEGLKAEGIPPERREKLTRLKERAYARLPFALTRHDMDVQAIPETRGLCRECAEGRRGASDSGCVRMIRARSKTLGTGVHLSGWPYAVRSLKRLKCERGVLLDDCVEQRFSYRPVAVPSREGWVGIFHHPPHVPDFVHADHHLQVMFKREDWRASRPFLLGGIALSEYLSSFLRAELGIPCATVKHPAEAPAIGWTMEAYLGAEQRRLLQIGWHLRNTRAIHQVPNMERVARIRVLPGEAWVRAYDANVGRHWTRMGGRVEYPGVEEREFIPATELETLLTQSCLITELLDASANNVIVDCIARNTPLVVNRHPAAVEYLTADYPLFFDDIAEVPALLADGRIHEGHLFLKSMDKSWLSGDVFCEDVRRAVASMADHSA